MEDNVPVGKWEKNVKKIFFASLKSLKRSQVRFTVKVMSKTKGQTFRYRFGNETKTFWYRSRICLVENRLFQFGPEYVLLGQIDMISFDGTDSVMKTTFWIHSC